MGKQQPALGRRCELDEDRHHHVVVFLRPVPVEQIGHGEVHRHPRVEPQGRAPCRPPPGQTPPHRPHTPCSASQTLFRPSPSATLNTLLRAGQARPARSGTRSALRRTRSARRRRRNAHSTFPATSRSQRPSCCTTKALTASTSAAMTSTRCGSCSMSRRSAGRSGARPSASTMVLEFRRLGGFEHQGRNARLGMLDRNLETVGGVGIDHGGVLCCRTCGSSPAGPRGCCCPTRSRTHRSATSRAWW